MKIKIILLLIISMFMFSTCYAEEYVYDYEDGYVETNTVSKNRDNEQKISNIVGIILGIAILIFMIVSMLAPMGIFYLIVYLLIKQAKNRKLLVSSSFEPKGITSVKKDKIYNDVDIKVVKDYLPSYELLTLKNRLKNTYIEIQNAWMLSDYNELKNKCSDVLYNYYVPQLVMLNNEGRKNIIKDIEFNEIKIIDIKKVYNIIYINAYVDVTYYDYIINTLSKNIVSGFNNEKVNNKYILTFEYRHVNNNKMNCPNCGAVINNGKKCNYCGTDVSEFKNDFILSKKVEVRR